MSSYSAPIRDMQFVLRELAPVAGEAVAVVRERVQAPLIDVPGGRERRPRRLHPAIRSRSVE